LNALLLAFAACLPCQDPDISELVNRLGSDDFVEQGRAAKSLELYGPVIVRKLRSLAEAPDGNADIQAWCRRLADRIERNERRFAPIIEKLGSADDEVKDAAEWELLRAGPVALPFLRLARESENKNLRFRADKLIQTLSSESNLAARLWTRVKPGAWMDLPLQSLAVNKSLVTPDGKLSIEDVNNGPDIGSNAEIPSLPMPWGEVSGVQVQVQPTSASHSFLVIGVGSPVSWHVLGLQNKEPLGFYAFHAAGDVKAIADPGVLIGRTTKYLLRIEHMGKRWRFCVGDVEVKSVDPSGIPLPSTMRFVVNEGHAEFSDFKVRKK